VTAQTRPKIFSWKIRILLFPVKIVGPGDEVGASLQANAFEDCPTDGGGRGPRGRRAVKVDLFDAVS
jgi:hypothetical protein